MEISVTRDVFKLAQVFTISRGSRTEAKVLTVRVTEDGVTGWGECVPYARYGETLENVTDLIEGVSGPVDRQGRPQGQRDPHLAAADRGTRRSRRSAG